VKGLEVDRTLVKGSARVPPRLLRESEAEVQNWFDSSRWNSYHCGMKSVISEKGQVTIPKPVREKLGLRPGTEMEFEAVGGRLVGHKAVSADPFAKWRGRGKLPKGRTVDDYLKEIRGADGD